MSLELEISLAPSGDRRLFYTLRQDGDEQRFVGPEIRVMAPLQSRIIQFAEMLVKGYGPAGEPVLSQETAIRRLQSLGQDLFVEFLPAGVRDSLERLTVEKQSLQIISDEPWLPWEMICHEDRIDGFLAATIGITRWLKGFRPPPRELDCRRILLVESAVGSPGERQALAELASRLSVSFQAIRDPTAKELDKILLDGGFSILHVSAHGSRGSSADGAFLQLGARETFCAADLHRAIENVLRREQPLVFFNACQVGIQGFALTSLGGWAARLLQAGCSAFIAPIWAVRSHIAGDFAADFYRALGNGKSFTTALLLARRAAATRFPDDPTWLAYQAYGNPERVVVVP